MLKNSSIKVKIIGLILISLAILSIVITTFAVLQVKNSLFEENFAKLTSARDSKKHQIEKFFEERVSDINVLARSNNVKNLIDDLIFVHKELGVKGNEKYPVNNSFAKEKMQPHEDFFQGYMKDYGYYDIFVICRKHGHVMYTAAKESDFGENLQYGVLKDSALASLWRKVRNTNKTHFIDMKPYAPSNGAPAMFLGTPVSIDGEFRSVLVFQISDKAINEVMGYREGYGSSQEDYLVGQDKLMRSDSYLDPKGHSLLASFANPEIGKVETAASIDALDGNKGTKVVIDYNGNPVLSAYAPVKIGEDITWAIMSEIDESEVLETPNKIRNIIIGLSLIIFIIMMLIAVFLVNKIILNPLKSFQNGLLGFFSYLNKEKNDVNSLDIINNDEIGSMAQVVNENITNIKKGIDEDNEVLKDAQHVLGRVKNGWYSQHIEKSTSNTSLESLKNDVNDMIKATKSNIQTVNSTLQEYANYNYRNELTVSNIEKGGVFEQLINDINGLKDAITQMLVENKKNGLIIDSSSNVLLSNVDSLNQSSNEAAASLEETAAALEEITGNVSNTTEKISEMSVLANQVTTSASQGQELATKTTSAMDEINKQVTSINEAITVIDQIAFQTNILSLNAAVEAATAGEAGKGFAVVAAEVRNLASRSAEAAKEIKDLVESANIKANEGKNIADSMIEGYTNLNTNIDKTIELISDVSNASKEQEAGILQINDAINSLDQQTQKNAAVASETKNIAESTSLIATNIVENADAKEFNGKDSIDISKEVAKTKPSVEQTFASSVKPTFKAQKKEYTAPVTQSTQSSNTFVDNSSDDEWESF